jgi:hypothetical protein
MRLPLFFTAVQTTVVAKDPRFSTTEANFDRPSELHMSPTIAPYRSARTLSPIPSRTQPENWSRFARRPTQRDRSDDSQAGRIDVGCIAQGEPHCANSSTEIEDRRIQNPHPQSHTVVSAVVLRRLGRDRAGAARAGEPRTESTISPRRRRIEQLL